MRSTRPFSMLRTMLSGAAVVVLLAGGPGRASGDGTVPAAAPAGLLKPSLVEGSAPAAAGMPPSPTAVARQRPGGGRLPGLSELLSVLGGGLGLAGSVLLWRRRRRRRGKAWAAASRWRDATTGLPDPQHVAEILDGRRRPATAVGSLTAVYAVDMASPGAEPGLVASRAGDLARAAADCLRAACPAPALLGRFADGRFLVAHPGLGSVAEVAAQAHAFRLRLLRVLHQGPGKAPVDPRIGVAVGPESGGSALALVHEAEAALRLTVAEGGGAIRSAHPAVDATLHRRQSLEKAVRQAADCGGFVLHFEPVFEAGAGRLTGFEALLRLPAAGDPILPETFMPIAEELGLADVTAAWALDEACRVAATWPAPLSVAVNLSPRQLDGTGLCGAAARALGASGLAADRLEIEVCEDALAANPDRAAAQVTRLRALGASVVLDDFGAGAASLNSIWRFRFDRLKVDRSLVAGLHAGDAAGIAALRSILSLGRTFRQQVGAAGVETAAQAGILTSLGCHRLQGPLLGRPLPGGDVSRIIRAGTLPAAGGRDAYVFKGRFAPFAA